MQVKGGRTILDEWLARGLQRLLDPVNIRLRLWDGSSACSADRTFVGDLIVRNRTTLLGLTLNPEMSFGEAYATRRLDVEGNLQHVLEALSRRSRPMPSRMHRIRAKLAPWITRADARQNVHHHYDLGNDFYRRWLDSSLTYTCAYFTRPEMSLDEAQRAKHDLICRKLRLRPGEVVVEAGCGWGTLALHMARHYGVTVRAFNVSREQLAFARDAAGREGLAHRVEFIDDDYRNITGQYDAFVSVGMLEHVGRSQFRDMSDVLRHVLRRSNGRGLLHFIGRDTPRPLNAWIRRRIFPGAYAPALDEVITHVLAPSEMTVIDVENLRLHYALTLAHWYRRFMDAADDVRVMYGDEFIRSWQLYLAGSEAAFATGWLQLFQVVFAPVETSPPYWTRSQLHAEGQTWSDAMR